MTCRGSVAPADEERTLLPLVQPGSPAAALNKAGGSGKSRNAASTLGMCACALGLCALFALGLFAGKSSPTAPSAPPADAQSLGAILQKAGHRALGGGLGGAVAGACQVCVQTSRSLSHPHPQAPTLRSVCATGARAHVAAHGDELSVPPRRRTLECPAYPARSRRAWPLLSGPVLCAAADAALALWRHRRQQRDGCALLGSSPESAFRDPPFLA